MENLSQLFSSHPLLFSLALILLSLIATLTLFFLLFRVLRRITGQRNNPEIASAVNKLKKPVLLLLVLAAIMVTLPMMELTAAPGTLVHHLISLITIFAVAWLLIRGVSIGKFVILHF